MDAAMTAAASAHGADEAAVRAAARSVPIAYEIAQARCHPSPFFAACVLCHGTWLWYTKMLTTAPGLW